MSGFDREFTRIGSKEKSKGLLEAGIEENYGVIEGVGGDNGQLVNVSLLSRSIINIPFVSIPSHAVVGRS